MSIMDLVRNSEEKDQYNDLNRYLTQLTRQRQLPYSLLLELTPNCTLNCKMCYVHSEKHSHTPLNADEWIKLASDAQIAGVQRITLSGGEAMFHPEFKRIYTEIYDMGFEIAVMSNATLFSDEMIELFQKRPPYRFAITIYGYSSETYRDLCGNENAFLTVKSAIEKLDNLGFPLILQTTVTKENIQDVRAIFEFAQERSIPFQQNSFLLNLGYSNESTIATHGISEYQRENMFGEVSPQALCEIIGDRIIELARNAQNRKIQKKGITCGAGNNVVTINWRGEMICCASMPYLKQYPLLNDFSSCVSALFKEAKELDALVECQTCLYANKCITCPGAHFSDTGEWGIVSARYCWKKRYPELAKKDKEYIDNWYTENVR